MHHGKLSKTSASGLKQLRKRIAKANIPSSKLDESVILATWNIREFGRRERKTHSLHLIAEILNQFDLIALVEVRDNVSDLKKVMDILGPYWQVVFSDFIVDRGGNQERIAYLFDKRAVTFTGLASEAESQRKKRNGEWVQDISWWRSPFMASFRAGSFDFVLISAHIRWGKKAADREAPLKALAEWVDRRRREKHHVDKDIIVMGDFNIPSRRSKLYDAVTDKGLVMPASLAKIQFGSNLAKNKRYDQILSYPTNYELFSDKGGILDFYTGGINKICPGMGLTKTEFTYQLSDHLPLWVQLNVDDESQQLEQILNPGK